MRAGHAEGEEDRANQAHPDHQAQHRGVFEQQEVAAGIFQQHRLVHHGEFEMAGGVVRGDAPGFGQGDGEDGDEGEAERDRDADMAGAEGLGDAVHRGRMGDQHEADEDDEQGGFGEDAEQRLARRGGAAEAEAGFQPGQHGGGAAQGEQADQRDEIAEIGGEQPGAEARRQHGGDRQRGEGGEGPDMEELGGGLGHQRGLAQQAGKVAVGLDKRRAAPAEQSRAQGGHKAEQQRGEREDQHDVQ